MGHFNWIGTGDTGGGGSTATSVANTAQATFTVRDANGKVLASPTLNHNKVASYTKLLTASDIGQKTITARFTGDHVYAAGSLDTFSVQVPDNNNLNATQANAGTVNQLVAGPGIYISAPNGQGVVTISTEPLNLNGFTGTLYDISWSEIVYDYDQDHKPIYESIPYGIPGQFTAVGVGGAVFRSRDGHNWVQMYPYTSTNFSAIASEVNPNYLENKMEYIAVGSGGYAASGYLGGTSDSLDNVGQLYDQHGAITDEFYGVGIFVNDAQVVNNKQFTGGITDASRNYKYSATDTYGIPIVVAATAEVVANWKITNVRLLRDDGSPAIEFSQSGNDNIKLQVDMYVDDIRLTPGTPITGQHPILVNNPIKVLTEISQLPASGGVTAGNVVYTANKLADIVTDMNNYVTFTYVDNAGHTQNALFFNPYITVSYRDVLDPSYPNNAYQSLIEGWAGSGGVEGWNSIGGSYNNTRINWTLGNANVDFTMGQLELKFEIQTYSSNNFVDYSYTSIITIGA